MSENTVARRAALWVGLVFLLGAALGGTLGYVFANSHIHAAPPPQLSDTAKRQQKVEELTRELSLTPEQAQQADSIIADIQTQFRAIRAQTDPQVEEARQKGRDRMRAILTPEQKPKFEEVLRRLDEKRKKDAANH